MECNRTTPIPQALASLSFQDGHVFSGSKGIWDDRREFDAIGCNPLHIKLVDRMQDLVSGADNPDLGFVAMTFVARKCNRRNGQQFVELCRQVKIVPATVLRAQGGRIADYGCYEHS